VARRPHESDPVTLLAVSKGQPVQAIEALYALGHRDFGGEYAQELAARPAALAARGCTEIAGISSATAVE